ncbi:MAG: 50S ribosome-binding GTPase [Gammaproteobacteria bacterium]|nr:50S ribosome-binding GTPase [Gammaproteobacteria bacterium]
MNPASLRSLCHFTSHLISRYRALDPDNPSLLSLIYANGLLLRAAQTAPLPLQLAVIGPTQVGKSSLVNLLLGSDRAGVSPLAGHTRHAQGFASTPLDNRQRSQINDLLPGLSPAEPEQLFPDKVGYYSLIQVPRDSTADALPPMLVWDSPDFDSVSSRHYRTTVPALCALTDLVVMLVSKEKYADQSVWELLRLIAPAGLPLVLVINKVPAGAADELMQIVAAKFAAEGLPPTPLFCLPYLHNPTEELAASAAARQLLAGLRPQLQRTAPHPRQLAELLQRHWSSWTAPLQQELAAARTWRDKVATELHSAEQQFERDYLKNPDYRESLDKAILQLLQLLELPGLAAPLARARELVTWPVRQAVSLFQRARNADAETSSMEAKLLSEALRQARQRLLHQATVQAGQNKGRQQLWWQHLWLLLQQRESELQQQGLQLIDQHQRHFQPEIDSAANRLLGHLQEHPRTLNTLRATRASADAAAVAFALKSGGIGLSDLILTPAMLAFSTLLTEGAVGQFMEGIGADLNQAQRRSVQEQVFAPLQQQLLALPADLPQDLLFGLQAEELQRAEQARARLG